MTQTEKTEENFNRLLNRRNTELASMTRERDALQKELDSLRLDYAALKKDCDNKTSMLEELHRLLEERNNFINVLQKI